MANNKQLAPEEKTKYWQNHIKAWQKSGQSQIKYCQKQKIKISTFGYWRTRLSRKKTLVEVPVKLETHSVIEIVIKDSIKVKVRIGFDPELLIQIIKTLEQLS